MRFHVVFISSKMKEDENKGKENEDRSNIIGKSREESRHDVLLKNSDHHIKKKTV